jgi:ribosomal protein L11 methyltransferase
LLEERMRGGERVLDVGTGSGILALSAARLGAREVLAVDVDPAALNCARANVALNDLAGTLRAREGSVDAVDDAPYDLAVANILAPYSGRSRRIWRVSCGRMAS